MFEGVEVTTHDPSAASTSPDIASAACSIQHYPIQCPVLNAQCGQSCCIINRGFTDELHTSTADSRLGRRPPTCTHFSNAMDDGAEKEPICEEEDRCLQPMCGRYKASTDHTSLQYQSFQCLMERGRLGYSLLAGCGSTRTTFLNLWMAYFRRSMENSSISSTYVQQCSRTEVQNTTASSGI
jgi:hypothetical protein